jgi:hypothetical protein
MAYSSLPGRVRALLGGQYALADFFNVTRQVVASQGDPVAATVATTGASIRRGASPSTAEVTREALTDARLSRADADTLREATMGRTPRAVCAGESTTRNDPSYSPDCARTGAPRYGIEQTIVTGESVFFKPLRSRERMPVQGERR